MTITRLQLQATSRATSKTEREKLRATGQIPCILYGHGITNLTLALPKGVFEKTYQQAGESTLIDVVVDGKNAVKALIQDVDRHPLSGDILHVDLYQVRMDEKISNDVPVVYVGESAAVKALGGILVKNLANLPIRCLPADLPHDIQVDIAALENFESRITVADLTIPAGVEVLAKPEDVVAVVEPPRSEEELKALDDKVEVNVDAVGKVEKEKKPDEDAEAEAPGAAKEKEKEKEKKG
ncbi:MAG: 50S ribosomal protein L25 [Patescibacteria group bacterium]